MTGALRIHALVIVARVLVRIGAAAEGLSLSCRRRAGRILDEAVAWCDARLRNPRERQIIARGLRRFPLGQRVGVAASQPS